jgi:hypothetical protein
MEQHAPAEQRQHSDISKQHDAALSDLPNEAGCLELPGLLPSIHSRGAKIYELIFFEVFLCKRSHVILCMSQTLVLD